MKNILTTSIAGVIALQPLSQNTHAYELHEWGTFTSVSGSDGVLLGGLHREEERLPSFVYALDGMQNTGPGFSKGFRTQRPLKNVTIKMETPVIYFYSDKPFHAHVEVGFNGGAISQWFPRRSGGETVTKAKKKIGMDTSRMPPYHPLKADIFQLAGGIDFANKRSGSIQWEVDVLAKGTDRGIIFKPGETLNWVYPRNPKANILKVQGDQSGPQKQADEYEDYLFYRGVGNFPLPVKFTVNTDETLVITNNSNEKIPFLFVHENTSSGIARFHAIPTGLEAGKTLNVPVSDLKEHTQWQRPVYQAMYNGLTKTGLFAEEAHGMIQTWWHSYFFRPGLRVFWIVPQSDTHQILPLSVKPAPTKIVRTLVGRSEILRPSFENNLVKAYTETDKKKRHVWNGYLYDRFGHAYQQRAQQLAPKKTTTASATSTVK